MNLNRIDLIEFTHGVLYKGHEIEEVFLRKVPSRYPINLKFSGYIRNTQQFMLNQSRKKWAIIWGKTGYFRFDFKRRKRYKENIIIKNTFDCAQIILGTISDQIFVKNERRNQKIQAKVCHTQNQTKNPDPSLKAISTLQVFC